MSEPQPDRTEILFYWEKKKKSHSSKPQNVDINFGYNPPNLRNSHVVTTEFSCRKI